MAFLGSVQVSLSKGFIYSFLMDLSHAQGLSSTQAHILLRTHGKNVIHKLRQFGLLRSLKGQFTNILTVLLIAAGIVSLAVGQRLDSIFIFAVVAANACFGIYQEHKAENALSRLKDLQVSSVRVIRDGQEQ